MSGPDVWTPEYMSELREMPSSLNDACRKLEIAADEITRLRAETSALRKALEECRTAYCGYVITNSEQYPEVLADFMREIRRIDGVARAASISAERRTSPFTAAKDKEAMVAQQIIAALRAAVHQAISALGEQKAREIINSCFQQYDDDHWGRR